MTKKKEKIEYKVYCFRLNEQTYKRMFEDRLKSGLSWNRYILELIEKQNGIK